MKSNKKRGFTLVELLVVIAILAILATVSVVGYTSFIERATVSNDENVASQLNQFLIALKADSNSEYYQVKIDETNVREITRYILRESGLDELEPQSEKYGYHFYFDLANQKYVLAADRDVTSSLATRMFAHAEGEKYFLGSCFTDGNYFLADTKGDLAEVINAIYTATNGDEINSAIALVDTIEDASIKEVVDTFVNSSVIVTDGGNYRVVADPTKVIFTDNVSVVKTETFVKNGNGWPRVDADKLANTDKVVIPDSVEYFAENSLNIAENGEIVINKTPEEIGNMAQDVFAGTTITITTTNGQFTCNVENAGAASVDVIVSKTDSSVKIELTYSNPMTSFSGTLSSSEENKVKDVTTDGKIWGGYIAWDVGSFTITPTKFVGENSAMPATQNGVKWEPSPESDSYIDIVGNTVTINYSAVSSLAEMPETLTIIGTPTDEGNKSETVTFVIETVYLKTTTCTIEGRDAIVNPNSTFLYGGDGKTSYKLVKNVTPNKTVDGISLGYSISISNPNFVLNGSSLTLASGKETTTTGLQTIEVKVENYEYLNNTINLTMYNANLLTFLKSDLQFNFIGDGNSINASDLFKLNTKGGFDTNDIPSSAEIWVVPEYGDDNFSSLPELKAGDYAENTVISISDSNTWGELSIKFKNGSTKFDGSGNAKAVVIIVAKDHDGKYIRISDNCPVSIVSGNNVKSYSELETALTAKVNAILLSNITIDDGDQLTVDTSRLYGNNYIFDIRKGINKAEHIIKLQNGAILDTVKIVGSVYTSFTYDKHAENKDGSSAVLATAGTEIINSYIANTRSPLRVTGNVTVTNSIFFGGKYANIDVTDGVLTLVGDITTINQVYNGNAGLGIIVDLRADADTKVVANDCNLKQYNFLPKTLADNNKLPTVSMTIGTYSGSVNLNTTFNEVFKNAETDKNYQALRYEDGTNYYFNAGIVYANTYKVETKGKYTGKVTPLVNVDNGGVLSNAPDNYNTVPYTEIKGPKLIAVAYITVYVTLDVYSPARLQNGSDVTANVDMFNQRDIVMNTYLPENYCSEIYN